jgi:alpha-beta hydrolase superfamily lysophospholipase
METLPIGPVRRVVLGVHGFGGSCMDEIQEGIAEEMRLFEAAVFRFDFPAHGKNTNTRLTLKGCVDALTAVALEAKLRHPDVEDMCIFASGFGAFVTLNALHNLLEQPGRIRLVLQTPSVRMDETLLSMINRSRETLQAMGEFELAAPRPFVVTYDLYQELLYNSVMMSYAIPMLILHGEADSYIRMADIQLFHHLNEESKLVIIPGTSHRFLEAGAWDMVLDLTRDWFEYEQVLLSDWD